MELSQVFGGDSLKASDLQGHEIPVVIASVEMKKFDDKARLLLKFEGKKKVLICNKTNANRIAHSYGTNTDNWIGQEITLYPDLVDFQGRAVEAIRVRAKKPVARPFSAEQQPAPRQSAPVDDMDSEIPF